MAPNLRKGGANQQKGVAGSGKTKDTSQTIYTSSHLKSPAIKPKAGPAIPFYPTKSPLRRKSLANKSVDGEKALERETLKKVDEHTVPWVAALTTYFSYAVLMIFGYLRDALQNILSVIMPSTFTPRAPEGYAPLMADFQFFYTRRLYHRISDCFNRPISSAPGAWVDVMKRRWKADDPFTMEVIPGETVTALNLSSYNYLGFAECEQHLRDEVVDAMRRYGVGNCSSRSEMGTMEIHKQLEERIARFVGKPDAIVFGMGFATNSMVLPAIIGKGGLIISDELNHSSIVTGARSSGAKIKVFKHNDAKNLEETLRQCISEGQPRTHRPWGKILVIVEGLYSMEGEICNLREIVEVCKKYKAYLYVDEAHSIGALGKTGRGVLEHCGVAPSEVDIMMGTFTKSFGSVGGYIAGSEELIRMLRRVCPASVYACSMSPVCVMQSIVALRMIMGEDGTTQGRAKIDQLKHNANMFRSGLERMGCEVLGDVDSPVVPVMLYNPAKIPAFSRECLERKLAVVVVGFPATPLIKSRVRFCISAGHTEEDLIAALKIIDDVADRVMIKYKWNGRPNVITHADLLKQNKEAVMNVVGEWDAHHFGWRDSLVITPDGRFARGNGDEGNWHVRAEGGKTILELQWDRWDTEVLILQPADAADASTSPCPSPRRHTFKGQGNIAIGNMPIHSTFTLKPKQGGVSFAFVPHTADSS